MPSWWDAQGIGPGDNPDAGGILGPTTPGQDNFPTPGSIPGNPGAPASGASGNPMDRDYIRQQLTQLMQAKGITPGARGSGPADIEYYIDQVLATGGWQGGNAGYWSNRWNSDASGGGGSMGGLGGGSFSPDDPSYKWRLQQGLEGVEKSAAARGNLLTGGTLKDLTNYAQGLASTEYGAQFGRQYSLADLGLRGTIAAGGNAGYGTGPGQVYLPPNGQIGPGQTGSQQPGLSPNSGAFSSVYGTKPPFSLAQLKY